MNPMENTDLHEQEFVGEELRGCRRGTEDDLDDDRMIPLSLKSIQMTKNRKEPIICQTSNNEQQYQPLTFDAIKIGLASPEKILEWSQRRGYKAGDDQLQNVETGKRRSVL